MNSPNVLYKTRTYLVGPMENVSEKESQSWRETVTSFLNKLNVTIFNPLEKPFLVDVEEGPEVRERLMKERDSREFDKLSLRMRKIRIFDLNLVDRSDFIVANIDPQIPSWGTVEEITTGVKMKKPVFISVKGGKSKCPLWIFGMLPHKYIFDSLTDLLSELRDIDGGLIEPDSRWRLLKKELR